jgi:small subunit ribosomal protein S9
MSQINIPTPPAAATPSSAMMPGITGLSTVNPSAEARPAQMVRKVRPPAEPKKGWWWGTGRRKRAVARVRIRPVQGEGAATIRIQLSAAKFKTIEQYFAEERDRNDCAAPLKVTNTLGKMEVVARLDGGGFMGQAQAVRLGVARALRDYDPTLEDALRDNGFLTRDAREVERKKYGQAGARRRFQFSKR